MIYLIYGDPNKTFEKANSLIGSLIKKNSDSNFVKVDSENFEKYHLDELIGGQSLFTGKQIIYLKKIFSDKIFSDNLEKRIKEISESPNIFIIVEEKLNKLILNKLEKSAEKIQHFEKKESKVKKDNIFDLADALGNKDVQKLWLLYQEKIKKLRPEEIHGIFWWQVKNILIVKKTSKQSETGLAPFVYNKAKSFSKKYSDLEIEKMANDLINILHLSRRRGLDLNLALEKFILMSAQQDSNLRPSA